MTTDKISIIVPMYGAAGSIANCANSLFSQTHPNIEYIFVNDCSPDNTVEVLRKAIANSPNRKDCCTIINNPVNMGVCQSRGIGLNASTGKYIMFVDSDDTLPMDACKKLIDAVIADDYDIAIGAYEEMHDNNELTPINVPKKYRNCYLDAMLCQSVVNNSLWGKIYKRDIFASANGLWSRGINIGEDFMILAFILPSAKIKFIDDVVYSYNLVGTHCDNKLTQKQFSQTVGANTIVWDHYASTPSLHRLLRFLKIGIVNLLRVAQRSECDNSLAIALLAPSQRIWVPLLTKPALLKIGNFLFKAWRKVSLAMFSHKA